MKGLANLVGNRPRLADPLHRLAGRWQSGGIEDYRLNAFSGRRRRSWVHQGPQIEITEHRVDLEGLGSGFAGLRIAHLTDIHHGIYFSAEDLREIVHRVNELAPDIVALTGDFVTRSSAYIEPVAEILGSLRASKGVFAVLGNHDFRVGPEAIAQALRASGIEVLRNRHVVLRHGAESLYFAGIDDWNYSADLSRALGGIPPNAVTILLSHNPRVIQRAAHAGIGLVLSGHTHGGQVRLPMVGGIYGRNSDRSRFKEGWGHVETTHIYVSRGIGTVVLPVRYHCPAEIPFFTLDIGSCCN